MPPSREKSQGELTEIRFLLKVASLGLVVAKPWGDNLPYDFLAGQGGRFFRVQVKSVAGRDQGAYRVLAARGSRSKLPYSPAEVDLLAAFIIPERTWYLIPVRAFAPLKTLRLYPHLPSSRRRFERYREAWHLLAR